MQCILCELSIALNSLLNLPPFGGFRYKLAPMDPKKLPIYELRAELAEALKNESRIIIEAPTGSGKSTQVPQMVLDCGNAGQGEVVVLQPRRLAARLLA